MAPKESTTRSFTDYPLSAMYLPFHKLRPWRSKDLFLCLSTSLKIYTVLCSKWSINKNSKPSLWELFIPWCLPCEIYMFINFYLFSLDNLTAVAGLHSNQELRENEETISFLPLPYQGRKMWETFTHHFFHSLINHRSSDFHISSRRKGKMQLPTWGIHLVSDSPVCRWSPYVRNDERKGESWW
jgi:hypothetical protein